MARSGRSSEQRVGASAASRMLFGVAERCYRKAGTPRALDALASLYDNTDRTAEGVALMRARAMTDDPAALRWLRNHQRSTRVDESAFAAARRLVEIGGPTRTVTPWPVCWRTPAVRATH